MIKKALPSGAFEVHDWDETCEENNTCSKMYDAEDYETLFKIAKELEKQIEELIKGRTLKE